MRYKDWCEVALPDIQGLEKGAHAYARPDSDLSAIVGRCKVNGWHLSLSHPWRYPTWDEISHARYALIPDAARMVMHLPPKAEYVNVHPNCFHLHECRCGAP